MGRDAAARTTTSPPSLVPMKARTGDLPPPDDERWAYEFKWDGVRAIVHVMGDEVRLVSRNGNDLTPQFPELAHLPPGLAAHDAVLDGEIVAIDPDTGRPSFGLLQQRLNLRDLRIVRARQGEVPAQLFLFDLLWLDGEALLDQTYQARRRRLEALDVNGASWSVPRYHVGDPQPLLQVATANELEGLMAKRLDSTYRPGLRSDAWRKIKIRPRQEFIIIGWTPGQGARAGRIGALLLGYHGPPPQDPDDDPVLRYAGRVGTGLDTDTLERMRIALDALTIPDDPVPFDETPRDARFVQPSLVCEVEFAEWTHEHHVRQASFKGLRTDKDASDIVREPITREGAPGAAGVAPLDATSQGGAR